MTTINPDAIRTRRRGLRQDLVQLEKQIFDLEGNYLENTREFGNIFTGWNHYVSQQHLFVSSSGAQQARVGRGGRVGNEERLFSLSSLSSPASRRDELKRLSSAGEKDRGGSVAGSPAGSVSASGRKRRLTQAAAVNGEEDEEQEDEEEEE